MQQSNEGPYLISDPGAHLVTVQPHASVYFGIGWADAYMAQGGTTKGCVSIASASIDTQLIHAPVRLGEGFCPPGLSVTAIAPKQAWAATATTP